MTDKKFIIYTDGACSANGKENSVGGWGAILQLVKEGEVVKEKEMFGGELNTTNNRMELMGVIKSLDLLSDGATVEVYSDSKYVVDGATSWIKGWVKSKWVSSQKQPVVNKDLWLLILNHLNRLDIKFHWVKGHDGNTNNERADRLAVKGAKEAREKQPELGNKQLSTEDKPVDKPKRKLKSPSKSGYEQPVDQQILNDIVDEIMIFARGERACYGWFAVSHVRERKVYPRRLIMENLLKRIKAELQEDN